MKNHFCDSYNFDKKLNTERKSINILFFCHNYDKLKWTCIEMMKCVIIMTFYLRNRMSCFFCCMAEVGFYCNSNDCNRNI